MNVDHYLQSLFNLSGKIACVTGASTGIGRTMAHALAKAGASVVVTARREELLAQTADQIKSEGGQSSYVVAELKDTEYLTKLFERVSQPFGTPDILVNAAGINLREPVEEITLDSWEKTIEINLRAPFFLARTMIPEMRQKGWGKIINLASLQSSRAFSNGLPYGASKGGIVQMTRAMAEEWSKHGICCNAIAPGFFPTELTAPIFSDASVAAQKAAQTAIGRNGELYDLEGIAVFLASQASDYITGQTIYVDGGFTAK